MLSALEGQNEVFLGQCTKLVVSRVDSPFFARQLSYSLLAILSYYASTAGSAATAVFDWSMHRQTLNGCRSTVSYRYMIHKKTKDTRLDQEKNFPAISWVWKLTEKRRRSARSKLSLTITDDQQLIDRIPIKDIWPTSWREKVFVDVYGRKSIKVKTSSGMNVDVSGAGQVCFVSWCASSFLARLWLCFGHDY